jgi:hypothetical protein
MIIMPIIMVQGTGWGVGGAGGILSTSYLLICMLSYELKIYFLSIICRVKNSLITSILFACVFKSL